MEPRLYSHDSTYVRRELVVVRHHRVNLSKHTQQPHERRTDNTNKLPSDADKLPPALNDTKMHLLTVKCRTCQQQTTAQTWQPLLQRLNTFLTHGRTY